MKKQLALTALLVFQLAMGLTSAFAQNDPNKKEWIQLFNGRNLDGWLPKIAGYALNDNFGDTFRVEDGMLVVSYDKYDQFRGRFGHIFYHQKFSYYIIGIEYRFVGKQIGGAPDWGFKNSGIMVHCQPPETMLKEQDFPISIEVQLLGGRTTGERPNANMCSPGTNVVVNGGLYTEHCLNSSAKTFRGDDWIRVDAMVLGDSQIRHYVNGELVLTYEMPQIGGGSVSHFDPGAKQDGKLLTEGYISLQSESHPIQFRKVELLILSGCMDPKAKNYKTYFVKSESSTCRY